MERDKLEKVGIREFRSNISKYILGSAPIEVVRHGQTVGYYFPTQPTNKQAEIEALQALAKNLQLLLEEKRISEDDIVKEFRQMRSKEQIKATSVGVDINIKI